MRTLTWNDATMSCCGAPAGACSCGGHGHAPVDNDAGMDPPPVLFENQYRQSADGLTLNADEMEMPRIDWTQNARDDGRELGRTLAAHRDFLHNGHQVRGGRHSTADRHGRSPSDLPGFHRLSPDEQVDYGPELGDQEQPDDVLADETPGLHQILGSSTSRNRPTPDELPGTVRRSPSTATRNADDALDAEWDAVTAPTDWQALSRANRGQA